MWGSEDESKEEEVAAAGASQHLSASQPFGAQLMPSGDALSCGFCVVQELKSVPPPSMSPHVLAVPQFAPR